MITMCKKSVLPPGNLPKVPCTQTIGRTHRPGEFLVPAHATVGGGGSGGCNSGPPLAKQSDEDDSMRPKSSKPFLAKLTHNSLGELVGPAALVLSMYLVSSSVKNMGRGDDGRERGPPLTVVLQRGVLTAEHATVKNEDTRETFSLIMMALAVGAGASNAMGQSTFTSIVSGIASFSMAVWASSRRRKGV